MDTITPQPGCYVDNHWGQYAIARMVQVAIEFGWQDGEAATLAELHLAAMGYSSPPLSNGQFEHLVEASDEAEEWLNDNAKLDGHAWSWNDGDFGLYALENEEESFAESNQRLIDDGLVEF